MAERQGKYLANQLNKIGKGGGGRANAAKDMDLGTPFVYRHLGSMATIGRYKALVDLRQSKVNIDAHLMAFLAHMIYKHFCGWLIWFWFSSTGWKRVITGWIW